MFVINQKTIDEMKLVLESEGYKVVPLKEYKALQQESSYYQALSDYGVDNWSGYSDAMQSLESEEE